MDLANTFSPTTTVKPSVTVLDFLSQGIPLYLVATIIAIIILCSCFCCAIYYKHTQSKLKPTISTSDGEESNSSIEKYLPEIQKTVSPRTQVTYLQSPHESHRSDFDVFPSTKACTYVTDLKTFRFEETSDQIPQTHTIGLADTNSTRSPGSGAHHQQSSTSSTIYIRHNKRNRSVFDSPVRRTSSNRLEVSRNKSVFDSPVVLSTLPSRNTIEHGLLGHAMHGSSMGSGSLIALDGSVYGHGDKGTYASEGQSCLLRGGISRTNTIHTYIDDMDDVKVREKSLDGGKATVLEAMIMDDDEFAKLEMPKNPKLDFLASDEFIVTGSPSLGPVTHTRM